MPDFAVVLDVNIYLKAVQVFRNRDGKFPWGWLPPPRDQDVACLAVIGALGGMSRPFDKAHKTLIYTSGQLDDTIAWKLLQPTTGIRPEDRGLGWTQAEMDKWLGDLLSPIDNSGRAIIFDDAPAPMYLAGLDHEDACIYSLFHKSMSDSPSHVPILVTADNPFRMNVNATAPIGANGPIWFADTPGQFLQRLSG